MPLSPVSTSRKIALQRALSTIKIARAQIVFLDPLKDLVRFYEP